MVKKHYRQKNRIVSIREGVHTIMKKGKNGLYRFDGLSVDVCHVCEECVYKSPDMDGAFKRMKLNN